MERRKKSIVELTLMTPQQCRQSKKKPVIIVADNVRSMHNVGAILRTADCLGIEKVILAGITGQPPHPDIAKTALGAEESVNWIHVDNALQEIENLKSQGWIIYALEQTHGSINLRSWKRSKDEKTVIVVGNEVEGVAQEIIDICDACLEIEQFGAKHSLNVSVSAGIAMWQATAT